VFSVFDPEKKYQYILVFLTELPEGDDGRYRVKVDNIEVYGN
jgi:eukaryotic-like serine/threonine-protein kinase